LKKKRYLLAALAALVPASAAAEFTYHLGNKGLCNETQDTIKVRYHASAGVRDAKPDGITHHKAKQDLAPGKCATLSFKVFPGTEVNSFGNKSMVDIEVNDAWIGFSFQSTIKHAIQKDESKIPKGYEIISNTGTDHFQIYVRRVPKS